MPSELRTPGTVTAGPGTTISFPDNMKARDGATAAVSLLGGGAELVQLRNFAFPTMPSDATVNGIVVTARHYSNLSGQSWDAILKNNTTSLGSNKTKLNLASTTLTDESLGTSTDLWGTSGLTAATMKSSTFGVDITYVENSTFDDDVYVDVIEMTVHYTGGTAVATINTHMII